MSAIAPRDTRAGCRSRSNRADGLPMTITIPSFTLRNFGLYALTGIVTAALTFGLAWVTLPTPAPPPVVPIGSTPREGALGFGLVPAPNAVPKPLPAVPADAVITLVTFHKDKPPAPPVRAGSPPSTGNPLRQTFYRFR